MHAFVLERRATHDWHETERQSAGADCQTQIVLAQVAVGQIALHHFFDFAGCQLEQFSAILLGFFYIISRNLRLEVLRVFVVAIPFDGFHLDDVDDAAVLLLAAQRQLDDGRNGLQTVFDHVNGAIEVGAGAVHFVDEAQAWHLVFVGLTPHGFGLRLDTGNRVEHGYCAVQHAQRALDFDGEVHVTWGVNDVDAMLAPHGGSGSCSNGDAALLFLHHVVHDRCTFVHFADLVGLAGVIQHALSRGGFACINVRHDADVAILPEWKLSFRHGEILRALPSGGFGLPAVVGEGLVGFSHLLHVFALFHRRANTIGRIH